MAAIGCVSVWGMLSARLEADCDVVGCPTGVDDPREAKKGGKWGGKRGKRTG